MVNQVNYEQDKRMEWKLNQKFQQALPLEIIDQIKSYSPCDFKFYFEIHPRIKWYFGNGVIAPGAIDFRLYAARQIVEGLGFRGNIEREESSMLRARLGLDSAFLRLNTNPDIGKETFARITPFENLLWADDGSTGMKPLNQTILQLENLGLYEIEYPRISPAGFLETIKFWRAKIKLGNIMKKLEIKADDRTSLNIKFEDNRYWIDQAGAEFIMSRMALSGSITLESLMRRSGATELLGPRTLKVFEAIGYATVNNTQMIKFDKNSGS